MESALISPAFVCVWFLSRLEVVTVTTSSMNHVSVKKTELQLSYITPGNWTSNNSKPFPGRESVYLPDTLIHMHAHTLSIPHTVWQTGGGKGRKRMAQLIFLYFVMYWIIMHRGTINMFNWTCLRKCRKQAFIWKVFETVKAPNSQGRYILWLLPSVQKHQTQRTKETVISLYWLLTCTG